MSKPRTSTLLLILAVGMVSVSFGAILVRWAQEAPSLTIALYRMAWAWVLISPFYWSGAGRESSQEGKSESSWWFLAAGAALALHFAFWIGSLRFTTVAVSTLLGNTAPVMVAAMAFVFLKERLSARGLLGIGLAVAGATTLVWQDLGLVGNPRGPLLALAGAAMLALYLVVGRRVRRGRSLLHYVFPVYGCAALCLLLMTAVAGEPLRGFQTSTHLSLFLLGLVPQCLGHTSYNWALRYLSATVVSSLVLAEPILATVWAWLLLSEGLTGMTLVGGVLVGGGLLLVVRWGDRADSKDPVEIAAGLLFRGERLWIQRRPPGKHLAGYWEFPGGKLEPGESPVQALCRELREELGLTISPDSLEPFDVVEHSYPDRQVRIYFFRCSDAADPDPELEVDGTWERISGLPEFTFPEANRAVLDRLKALAEGPPSESAEGPGRPPDKPAS